MENTEHKLSISTSENYYAGLLAGDREVVAYAEEQRPQVIEVDLENGKVIILHPVDFSINRDGVEIDGVFFSTNPLKGDLKNGIRYNFSFCTKTLNITDTYRIVPRIGEYVAEVTLCWRDNDSETLP